MSSSLPCLTLHLLLQPGKSHVVGRESANVLNVDVCTLLHHPHGKVVEPVVNQQMQWRRALTVLRIDLSDISLGNLAETKMRE